MKSRQLFAVIAVFGTLVGLVADTIVISQFFGKKLLVTPQTEIKLFSTPSTSSDPLQMLLKEQSPFILIVGGGVCIAFLLGYAFPKSSAAGFIGLTVVAVSFLLALAYAGAIRISIGG